MEAAILINGIHLPYHVIDEGIEWALKNGKTLHLIFVYRSEEPVRETHNDWYVTEAVAEDRLRELIHQNSRFAEHQANMRNVSTTIAVLENPSVDKLKALLESVKQLFLDPVNFQYPEDLAKIPMTYEDIRQFHSSIVEVYNEA